MSSSGQGTTETSFGKPKLAIIGGSGMCSFPELKVISKHHFKTKYGLPSDEISICEHAGQIVAFLPRHGGKHTLAPTRYPIRQT